MSQATSVHAGHPRLLGAGATFHLQASVIATFLAGASAPTALYAVYQSSMGFSPTMLTVVFGIYAIGVLGSLLVFGRLSDYIGRRPVLLAATAAQAASMLLFVVADSTSRNHRRGLPGHGLHYRQPGPEPGLRAGRGRRADQRDDPGAGPFGRTGGGRPAGTSEGQPYHFGPAHLVRHPAAAAYHRGRGGRGTDRGAAQPGRTPTRTATAPTWSR